MKARTAPNDIRIYQLTLKEYKDVRKLAEKALVLIDLAKARGQVVQVRFFFTEEEK